MILEGDLRSVALPQVLQRIAIQGSTGILTVQGQEDIVAVSFLVGKIVAADALNQTLEEGLGKIFTRQNLITEEDFAAAARDHQGGSSGSLGELLVGRGLVTREQLLQGLRLQTYQLMLQVLTWPQGEFKFYTGDEVSFEEGVQPISIEELLIRSLEDLEGRGGLTGEVPDLEAIYRRLPSLSPVRVWGRDGDGSEGGLWLTEPQAMFLHEIDGRSSAATIARNLQLGRYQALFYLHRLLQCHLVERTSAKAEPASVPWPAERRPVERAQPAAPAPLSPAVARAASPSRTPTGELRAEIFTPPEPGELEGTAASPTTSLAAWLAPALALVLVAALAFLLASHTDAFLLPFAQQEAQRVAVERQIRRSIFRRFDRAVRTYHLLHSRFPASLDELYATGLIDPLALRDPAGYELTYSADATSYRLQPVQDGEPIASQGAIEGVSGDFLLDPQFTPPDFSEEVPLYLID